ncbi:hypothetical protein BTO04_12055 [Polaribacter sp. SA4-10]|uniref:FISUMP domain-containing protein n=1 Tax=Polaribacter sp. SA4-10 TaxID=754397 RepID=UPI000B3C312E|nr:FISUMP domain-containing protein [Polaribacter sp. SA4-10]ARV07375.1 hypothetical protein BTO04_12055 [Polaribacter sp. SA4-10]
MKKLLLCAAFIAASFTTVAQVGVGTATPQAALDVVSTTSGVLLPRVANIAAVTAPVNGMLIYDLSSNCFKGFENGAWTSCFNIQVGENDVVSTTGKIWMDRNLGATQVATGSQDFASYGNLYQWGRAADGHQVIMRDAATLPNGTNPPSGSSSSAAGPVASGSEGANFITGNSDWLSTQDDVRWSTGTEIAPVKTANDPCPSGYRVPTETELTQEHLSWSSNDSDGAIDSPLKLPLAGRRYSSNGTLYSVGSNGYYWSSTVSSTGARFLYFDSSNANMYNDTRTYGFSVRCIKD